MSNNRNDRNEEQSAEHSPALPNRREFLAAGLGIAAAASLLPLGDSVAHAQQAEQPAGATPAPAGAQDATRDTNQVKQEILNLSRQKWRWMSERKVDSLDALFHEEAVFVHMGGSMSRSQELNVIRTGGIQYKDAQIQNETARIIGPTAIVLSTIRLVAVVGGNEVTNPFVVTEVYVRQGDARKLAQLSFTRTMR